MSAITASKDDEGRVHSRALEDRRQEILHASLDLFSQSGFLGTSVRQIARAVGVNEATLYHYFPSKDAILAAVFEQVLLARQSALSQWCERGPASLEVILTQLGKAFLSQALTPLELKLTRLMLSEGPRLSEEGRQAFERTNRSSMQPAIDLFAGLMAEGRMRRVDPERAVMTFFAPLILWKLCHAMGQKGGDAADAEEILQHQVAMLVRALQPDSPQRE
jgi:AcrR family transcriptional regulator